MSFSTDNFITAAEASAGSDFERNKEIAKVLEGLDGKIRAEKDKGNKVLRIKNPFEGFVMPDTKTNALIAFLESKGFDAKADSYSDYQGSWNDIIIKWK